MRFALLALLWATSVHAESPKVVSGVPVVIDGDSLRIGTTSIRLFGIDAPEHGQLCDGKKPVQCGVASTRALQQIVGGQVVVCIVQARDRYKREVAICETSAGLDLGSEMVRSGHALAYRRYSTRYVIEEADAEKRGLGLWATTFTTPEDFRRAKRP